MDSRQKQAALGAAMMVLAGASFALVNVMLQYGAMTMGLSASNLAFWQYFVAFLFILPVVWGGGRHLLQSRYPKLHLIRVLVSIFGVQVWVLSLAHVPIWQAIALLLTSPIFVTIGAAFYLGERITLARAAAILIGAIGGLIILQPWQDDFTLYALLPLSAALLWAIVSVITKKITEDEDSRTITMWLLLLLTPANALIAAIDGFTLAGAGWAAVALVLALGLLTAFAQFCISRAYSLADAGFLQSFDHLKLPLNVLFGFWVFGWVPPGWLWLGSGLIILASIWLLRAETARDDS